MSSFRLPITETRLRQGAEAERAAIVAWLRSKFEQARYEGDGPYDPAADLYDALADAIERGDHLKEKQG